MAIRIGARRASVDLGRVNRVVAAAVFPEAMFRTCPWRPRDLIVTVAHPWGMPGERVAAVTAELARMRGR